MDDDENGQLDEWTVPAFEWSWKSFAVFTLSYVAAVAECTACYVNNVGHAVAAAHNHGVQRDAFQQAVARDIESITTQEG